MMTNETQKRRPWTTPRLGRIEAGSAENGGSSTKNDAGANPPHKS